MANHINLGEVMIYRTGTNPYRRDEQKDNPHVSGDGRKAALKQWRETGKLPEGYSAWDDRRRQDIQSPDDVFWGD